MAKDKRLDYGVQDDTGARIDRADEDRSVAENREVTDKVRLAERLGRLSDIDTVLPIPPKIPGYHTIWLSTTNTSDSLERRFGLGYELVSPNEVPGFAFPSQKSGNLLTDRIQINEMVLCKITNELYRAYLEHNHYTRPLEEENRIKPDITEMKDGRGKTIGIIEGEGFKELGQSPKPRFEGIDD